MKTLVYTGAGSIFFTILYWIFGDKHDVCFKGI